MNPATNDHPPKKSKALRYSLLAVTLLIITLYFLAPILISKVIHTQLQRLGFDAHTSIETPRFDGIFIPSAKITSHNQEMPFNLTLGDIQVRYQWWELITAQKVQSLNIASAAVELTADLSFFSQNTQQVNTKQIDLAALLPSELLPLIPTASVSIKQLELQWQATDQLLMKFSGKLDISDAKLQLLLHYSENNRATAKLEAAFTANNHFLLSLANTSSQTTNRRNTIAIEGDVQTTESQLLLKVASEIQLDHLNSQSLWLTEPILAVLANTQAKIQVNKNLHLPKTFINLDGFMANTTSSAEFMYEINSSAIKALIKSELNIAQVSAKGSGSSELHQQLLSFKIKPDSHLQLDQLTNQTLSAEQLNVTVTTPVIFSLSTDPEHLLDKLQLGDFSALVNSQSLKTPAGAISHRPIIIAITDIDIDNQSLTADYQIPQLTLDSLLAKERLPFSSINSQIAGKLNLSAQQINNTIEKNSKLTLQGLSFDPLSTDRVSATNNTAITVSYNRVNQQLLISDQQISIAPTLWKSPYGELTHPPLSIDISKIDTSKQSAQVDINNLILKIENNAKKSPLPFKRLTLNSHLQANISPTRQSLTLNKGFHLQLSHLKSGDISSQRASITALSPIKLRRDDTASKNSADDLASFSISPLKLRLTGSALSLSQHQLNYKSAVLDIRKLALSPLRLHAYTSINNASIKGLAIAKNINIFASHDITKNQHKIQANILGTIIPFKIKARGKSSKNYQKTQLTWQLSAVDLATHSNAIARALELPLTKETSVSAGSYQHTGQLNMVKDSLTANVKHQLNDLHIKQGDGEEQIEIAGINSTGRSLFKDDKLSQTGKLSIAAIESVVPITNIKTTFRFEGLLKDSPELHITNSSAEALDASLTLDDSRIELNPLSGRSAIHFTRLPLNNILALEQQPSLVGTGTLAGKLPFNVEGNKLWINNGEVYSTEQGYISYLANDKVKAYAATNKGLEIALNVLENFHYKNLAINANYTPDGKLMLRNKLSGKNPNWQQGQPIDFTINVEENVLQLLKALQFSDQLTQKLQKRIELNTP